MISSDKNQTYTKRAMFLSCLWTLLYRHEMLGDVAAILQGQVWRLVTFIIQPPQTNILFVVFVLLLYYMLGRQLELAWGTFRFNLYFCTGLFVLMYKKSKINY